jgi:uncharacterized protein (DUF1015 family)
MKSFLYDDEKIENLLPLVQQIDAFLIAKGYTREEAGKTLGGFDRDVIVNRLKYRKGNENVFITVNKPKPGVRR